MIDFISWSQQQDESSPFTRLRRDAAMGLKPPIPAAGIHSKSTASPFETEKLSKRSKKKRKKKVKPPAHINPQLDTILDKIEKLKKDEDDFEALKGKKEKPAKDDKSPPKSDRCNKRS